MDEKKYIILEIIPTAVDPKKGEIAQLSALKLNGLNLKDYDLLIIDNEYTANYLEDIENKKESIFKYLKMDFSDDVIEEVIDKYKLEPSNYIVDLLYEALIFESNNKE